VHTSRILLGLFIFCWCILKLRCTSKHFNPINRIIFSEAVIFLLTTDRYYANINHNTTSPVTIEKGLPNEFLTTSYRLPTDFPVFTSFA
jgi:hypothetical protein